jgi:23S rRNA (guanosine2251-2'-O)-methyltransferase
MSGRPPSGRRGPNKRTAPGQKPGGRPPKPGARSSKPAPKSAGRSGPNRSTRGGPGGGAGRSGPGGGGGAGGGAKGLGGRQVEGRQAVRELLMAERRKVHEVWISAELEGDPGVADIVEIAAARRVPLLHVARARLEREARSEAPQGVLAHAAEIPEADLGELLGTRGGRESTPPFLVAVDGVTDPGNLGAIIRSCDGAGVSGVLLPRHRSVHVTPTVAKASAGAVEYVPMALVPGLPAALKQLSDHGIWVVGLDDGADRSLYEIGPLATEPICVVLGAEGAGLSRLVRERCDSIVGIPMAGRISSLNVSTAAAIALYEVSRLRHPAS